MYFIRNNNAIWFQQQQQKKNTKKNNLVSTTTTTKKKTQKKTQRNGVPMDIYKLHEEHPKILYEKYRELISLCKTGVVP